MILLLRKFHNQALKLENEVDDLMEEMWREIFTSSTSRRDDVKNSIPVLMNIFAIRISIHFSLGFPRAFPPLVAFKVHFRLRRMGMNLKVNTGVVIGDATLIWTLFVDVSDLFYRFLKFATWYVQNVASEVLINIRTIPFISYPI